MLDEAEQVPDHHEQGHKGYKIDCHATNLEHRHQFIGVGGFDVAIRQIVDLTVLVPHPFNIGQTWGLVNG